MTEDKKLKRAARDLAEAEGISYTAARRRVMEDVGNGGQPGATTDRREDLDRVMRIAQALGQAVHRWNAANDAAGDAEEDADAVPPRPYDQYLAGAAMDARAAAIAEVANALALHVERGEGVRLNIETLRVLSIACNVAERAEQEQAARHRIEWGIPSLFPGTDVARLRLIRCESCRQYWRPDNTAYCVHCPRQWWGPTPRDRAEAETLRPHATLITADDLADRDDHADHQDDD